MLKHYLFTTEPIVYDMGFIYFLQFIVLIFPLISKSLNGVHNTPGRGWGSTLGTIFLGLFYISEHVD